MTTEELAEAIYDTAMRVKHFDSGEPGPLTYPAFKYLEDIEKARYITEAQMLEEAILTVVANRRYG